MHRAEVITVERRRRWHRLADAAADVAAAAGWLTLAHYRSGTAAN